MGSFFFTRIREESLGRDVGEVSFVTPKRPRDAADRRKRGALETLASILVRRL